MKKTTKITLVTSIILIGLGILFTGAGLASGGLHYALTADLGHLFPSATKQSQQIKKNVLPRTQLDTVTALDIQLDMLSMQIVPSPDEHAYISATAWTENDVSPIDYSLADGTLHVKGNATADGTVIGLSAHGLHLTGLQNILRGEHFKSEDNLLVLELPDRMLQTTDIHLTAGDLSVSALKSSHINMAIDLADVTMSDCTLQQGDLSIGAGDVHMENCHITDTNIRLDLGDFMDSGTEFAGKVSLRSEYGDITLSGKSSDFANKFLDASTAYGDIRIKGNSSGLSLPTHSEGDTDVHLTHSPAEDEKTAACRLLIQTANGDITLRLN